MGAKEKERFCGWDINFPSAYLIFSAQAQCLQCFVILQGRATHEGARAVTARSLQNNSRFFEIPSLPPSSLLSHIKNPSQSTSAHRPRWSSPILAATAPTRPATASTSSRSSATPAPSSFAPTTSPTTATIAQKSIGRMRRYVKEVS